MLHYAGEHRSKRGQFHDGRALPACWRLPLHRLPVNLPVPYRHAALLLLPPPRRHHALVGEHPASEPEKLWPGDLRVTVDVDPVENPEVGREVIDVVQYPCGFR